MGEILREVPAILGVPTSIAAFVGRTPCGPENAPFDIYSYADFERRLGGLHADFPVTYAVRDFFANGGSHAVIVRLVNGGEDNLPLAASHYIGRKAETAILRPVKGSGGNLALIESDYIGHEADRKGIFALDRAELFNLLCIPPDQRNGDTPDEVYQSAMEYCVRHRAMLVVDPKAGWGKPRGSTVSNAQKGLETLGLTGTDARNAALFFPRVVQSDPNRDGQLGTFVPCGMIAGIIARTDATRGVWKAPAGIEAALHGAEGLEVNLTHQEIEVLSPLGINCLKSFPTEGLVVWGARTLRGADQMADEYKYIPVRRTGLFLEESLSRGLQWVVFEPNEEPLWAQIRLNIEAFMHSLFRQGAFQGTTPSNAYFVKCDRETMTHDDINRGIVNIIVGFAPLRPAEFVIIKIQQMAGEIQT